MKVKASVTVMMTMVITIILAFMLVILEQDYRSCLKTIKLQTYDKALESVMGNFYAPLWSDYGLLAVPVGDGLSFANDQTIENYIKDNYNYTFQNHNLSDATGFIWKSELKSVEIDEIASFISNSGRIFDEQISKNFNYELMYYATKEISSLVGDGNIDIFGITFGNEKELKPDEKKPEDAEEPKEESSLWKLKKTLTTFLSDGFAGWWFADNDKLSGSKIVKSTLPSVIYLKDKGDDDLFGEVEFTEDNIEDGSYVDLLNNKELIESFNIAFNKAKNNDGFDFDTLFYANQYFGNFVHQKDNTKLKYEQEYLVFGNENDETNVKRTSWAIFGLRVALCIAAILSSPECQEKLSAYFESLDAIPWLAVIVKALVIAVWGIQNALVETAAILQGKGVDFIPTSSSLSVDLEEILIISKSHIQQKAKEYKGSGGIGLSYESYLMLLMTIIGSEKLRYRMMDLIEVNMQKRYNQNFKMDKCYVGFSAIGKTNDPSKYLGIRSLSVDGYKYVRYRDTLESAIYLAN